MYPTHRLKTACLYGLLGTVLLCRRYNVAASPVTELGTVLLCRRYSVAASPVTELGAPRINPNEFHISGGMRNEEAND